MSERCFSSASSPAAVPWRCTVSQRIGQSPAQVRLALAWRQAWRAFPASRRPRWSVCMPTCSPSEMEASEDVLSQHAHQLLSQGADADEEEDRLDDAHRVAGEIAIDQRMVERAAEHEHVKAGGRDQAQHDGPGQAAQHRAQRRTFFRSRHGSILSRVRLCSARNDSGKPAEFPLPVKSS